MSHSELTPDGEVERVEGLCRRTRSRSAECFCHGKDVFWVVKEEGDPQGREDTAIKQRVLGETAAEAAESGRGWRALDRIGWD